jgi:hypothetical protein
MENVARVLSLDLDWFNDSPKKGLTSRIYDFFDTLKQKCSLPRSFHLVTEHHYLYPWGVKLLHKLKRKKLEVVNIDEHHDFYWLSGLKFNDPNESIDCGNFFAFMAHKRLLHKYTWIYNRQDLGPSQNLRRELSLASSNVVKKFQPKISVIEGKAVFDSIEGMKFDGFIIVRSPEYTLNSHVVYRTVGTTLSKLFPTKRIKRYKHSAEILHGNIPAAAGIFV